MAHVSQGSVLKRNSRLQVEKGSSADERTDPIGISILQTLTYSDHFGFPLTAQEIHSRLCSSDPCLRRQACSLERVIRNLGSMLKSGAVQKSENYYHLPGKSDLVARRRSHQKSSAPQLTRATALANQLGRIPGVLAIYLTGSLSMSNSDGNGDIDFMIITHNHRLWTTRMLLTIYTEWLGLRRRPFDPHTSGKVCLNLYLTPMTYYLPSTKQNLYTSYELTQAVPLYDPDDTHSELLTVNSWIRDYLPNAPAPKRTLLNRNSRLQAEKDPVAAGRRVLMGTIESLCYHLQLLYMRPKITREFITPDSAFFHPNDPGAEVLRGLSSLGETPQQET